MTLRLRGLRGPSVVLPALIALALLVAACGQKPGVAGTSDQESAEIVVLDEPSAPAPAADAEQARRPDSTPRGDESSVEEARRDEPPEPRPGDAAPGTDATPTAASEETAAPEEEATAAQAGDRTGIEEDVLRIGMHAPVTGGAPFPVEAFEDGSDVYWQWASDEGIVLDGKRVELVFEDDQYNPSSAVRMCRRMVERDEVFMLMGFGGADQVIACARYANSVGVPYVSSGASVEGLDDLEVYFATSKTYYHQQWMTAQLAARHGDAVSNVVNDLPSFRESKAAFEQAADEQGLDVPYSTFISKGASDAEIATVGIELAQAGAPVVNVLLPPVTYLRLAHFTASQGYTPQWIGAGISNGLNVVATGGCPSIGDAQFLSPFQQLDVIDDYDPNFRPAYREYVGSEPDDIGLALWGLNKVTHAMLEEAGIGLTRESFVRSLEAGNVLETDIFPPVWYSPQDRFGGEQMHLLEADCTEGMFKTVETFVEEF